MTPTPADIGRRVRCRSTLPPGEEFGTLAGVTTVAEFVRVRFDGEERDEAWSSGMCEFVDEEATARFRS